MPFDFNTTALPVAETLALIAGKAPAADKRRAALDLFKAATWACETQAVDWRQVANVLAAVIPAAKAAPIEAAPDTGLEWFSYSDAQRKGRGAMFFPGRKAVFRFADGQEITVQLGHRQNLDLPDWARAARCAVQFYKAARTRSFLRLTDQEKPRGRFGDIGLAYGNVTRTLPEEYADSCAVPEIVGAHDLARDTFADPARCNAETEAMREGPRYLSELIPYALEAGGDWAAAWKAAYVETMTAFCRDKAARTAARFAEDAPEPAPRLTATTYGMEKLAASMGPEGVYSLVMARDKQAWFDAHIDRTTVDRLAA